MSVRRKNQKHRFARASMKPRHQCKEKQKNAQPGHQWSPKKGQPVTRGLKPSKPNGRRMSPRASLCALGLCIQKLRLFQGLYRSVKINQKTVKFRPVDKLVDCLLGMMCGIAGVSGINTTVRADLAVSLAFGRNGCAEASTIQDTLNHCAAEHVDQLNEVLKEHLHQYGRCTRHHRLRKDLLILDIDFSGQTAGEQAEGSTKGYFAGKKNKKGRQLVRVYASQYDEIVCQWMMPGNTSCNSQGVLQLIMTRVEGVFGLTPAQRARTLIRADAGFGTMENINWLLEQGYQVLVKAHNHNHVKKVARTVTQWEATAQQGRQLGWPTAPHTYLRPTVQLVIGNLKEEEKWEYHLLVSTLADRSAHQLKNLYDRRGGHPESSFQQDKQGLKLITRQKKNMNAQQMLVGLAQMAHNLLIWARCWPGEVGKKTQMAQWGIKRWVRDVLTIPGEVVFGSGQARIMLRAAHPLSQEFANAYGSLLGGGGTALFLGEI